MVPREWKEKTLRNLSVCSKLRKGLSCNIVDNADNVFHLSKLKGFLDEKSFFDFFT